MSAFQPETEVERELFAQLLERTKERDAAEKALARIRAILTVYHETYANDVLARRKRAKL